MPSIKIIDLKTINHTKHSFSLINQKAILMKKMLLIFGLALVSLVSCKKDKPVVLSAFEKLSYADIKASDVNGDLKINTIVIKQANDVANTTIGKTISYKTTLGTLGKLLIIDDGSNNATHAFVFDMVNYNPDGSVLLEKKNVKVNPAELCDLDLGGVTINDGAQSFLYLLNAMNYQLLPSGGFFHIYSN